MERQVVESTALPPGTYFVGDPCYAIPDPEWMPYLEHGGDDLAVEGLVVTLSHDRYVAAVGTAYGDGVYKGSDGNDYSVDAGLLGVVSVLDGDDLSQLRKLGTIVEFAQPFTVGFEDGIVFIGSITIDTDPQEEDDE